MDRSDHLLHSGVFPSTLKQPQLGFTFELLRDFHLQTLTSKKSPYDYLSAIRQKTSKVFLDDVPNPYSQFLRVQRVWRVLTSLKQSGQAHEIDKVLPFRRPGSVVVPCFACPEPGFNVPDDQWDTLDVDFEYLNTLMIMKDGHFGLQRFAKVDDPDDVSLLEGAGLFPPDEEYNAYVREVVAYSTEKQTCSKFSAVELQNKLKFKGAVITGVLAVECMRHVFFMAMVDLQKGERYANADYALAYALRRFTIARSLVGAKFFSKILETYDVACQYYVNLRKRFFENFFDLVDIIDIMNLLVPKKHLDGHKDDCKYRFSLNYHTGAGRSHGEGIEASWAESKQSGGSTRQMNHGHRHDTLNDLHNYWNWNKLRDLGNSLNLRLHKSQEMRSSMIEHFIGLSIIRGQESVQRWEQESKEPWLQGGEWHSVYRLELSKLPTQEAMLEILEAAEKAEAKKDLDEAEELSASLSRLKFRIPRLISRGIKLQDKQRELRAVIKEGGESPDDIKMQRKSLADDIATWRKLQLRALPQLETLILSLDPNVNAEEDVLYLPSDIPFEQHHTMNITSLATIEYQLREGEANEAVGMLCNLILHGMVLLDAKNEQSRGVYQNTRALKYMNKVKTKKRLSMARYRNARLKVLALTQSAPSTLVDFPVLLDEHTYAKNAATARNLGDGAVTDSWIWTYGRLKGLTTEEKNAFIIESEKVQWFRAQADMLRWVEEVELVEEEFRRVVRSCERMHETWTMLSTTSSTKYNPQQQILPGYCAYALQKADMYRKMGENARRLFAAAGGEWPSDDETLSELVRRRRPRLEVDWSKDLDES